MKLRWICSLLALSCFAFADLKSTNRMTVGGHTFSNTVLIKNGKIRNETAVAPGFSTVSIQDCTGHRLIQLNDRSRTYMVTDLPAADSSSPQPHAGDGALVTLTVNQQDTGERKQMFGYTARRIKGTIKAEGGAASCTANFTASTDGWYIDLPATQGCISPDREILRSRIERSGCNERVVANVSGVEKLGYPVMLDTTIDTNGSTVTVRQETTDLSSATLDASLFEVPSGYTQVATYRDLIEGGATQNSPVGMTAAPTAGPNFPPVTSGGVNENRNGVVAGETDRTTDKNKGALRIGITQITTSVTSELSVDGLQQQLVNEINYLGGQAVLIAADPYDRDATMEQAKNQGCDYVVFTNISNFKTASVGEKIGSVFNRRGLTGTGGTAQGRVDIGAEVKVFQPGNEVPVLDGNDDFRGNDPDNTAKGLMHTEARDVMLRIKGLQPAK